MKKKKKNREKDKNHVTVLVLSLFCPDLTCYFFQILTIFRKKKNHMAFTSTVLVITLKNLRVLNHLVSALLVFHGDSD